MNRNVLSRKQSRAIENWIQETWQDIERRRVSREETAGLCSSTLGFRVTPSNIATACETLELTWPNTPTSGQKAAWKLRVMREAIAHLYASQDIEPPNEHEENALFPIDQAAKVAH